jgi:UDP-N-acetylmuramate--alanine ligase
LPIAHWSWLAGDDLEPRAGSLTVLGKTRRVHFVGIGGAGMSGIAELLANLGYVVTGSDEKRSTTTDRLASLGIRVSHGHAGEHVLGSDVVVVSSAVRPTNVEVVEAQTRHIPVIARAEMLAELMRLRYSIAVAGAHGKTTTTSMIAVVLERAGLDPTAVIGGRLSAFGSNARLGRGDLIVVEADESDRSFLRLLPTIAVITNVDREHLESYGDFAELQRAFVDFANKVPFYGAVVACADDANLMAVVPHMTRRVRTYGLESSHADISACGIAIGPLTVEATVTERVRRAGGSAGSVATLGRLALRVPGRHNLQNALAAAAVGLELGLPFDEIASGLHEFRGAERRFDVRGEPNGILVVDDYGHHPTEIAAVLSAARALGRRLVVAFQPHRFTRTIAVLDSFGPALSGADHIVLTDIYPAGEDPIAGASLEALLDAIRRSIAVPVEVVPRIEDLPQALARLAEPGDVVITMGAGSIGQVAEKLIELLEKGGPQSAGVGRA